jgi:hypothetical protein
VVAAIVGAVLTVAQANAVAASPAPDFRYAGSATDFTLETDSGTSLVPCDTNTIQGLATTSSFGLELLTVDGPSSVWSGCTGPLGIEFEISAFGTWNYLVQSQTGSRTEYDISNVTLDVRTPDGTSCTFDVAGTVKASYDAMTHELTVGPDATLTTMNVSGCFGLVNDGDPVLYTATYGITTSS